MQQTSCPPHTHHKSIINAPVHTHKPSQLCILTHISNCHSIHTEYHKLYLLRTYKSTDNPCHTRSIHAYKNIHILHHTQCSLYIHTHKDASPYQTAVYRHNYMHTMPCHVPAHSITSLPQHKYTHIRSPNHSRYTHIHTDRGTISPSRPTVHLLYAHMPGHTLAYCTCTSIIAQHPVHPHHQTPRLLCTPTHTLPSPLLYTGGADTPLSRPSCFRPPIGTHPLSCAIQGDNAPLPHLTCSTHSNHGRSSRYTGRQDTPHPQTRGDSLFPPVLQRGSTQPPLLWTDRQTLSSPRLQRWPPQPPPAPHATQGRTPSTTPAPPRWVGGRTPVPCHTPAGQAQTLTPAPAATLPPRREGPARPRGRSTRPGRRSLPATAAPPAPPPARPASPPLPALGPERPGQPPKARRQQRGGPGRARPGQAGPQAHHGRGAAARPVVLATRSPEEGARCNACARAAAAAAAAATAGAGAGRGRRQPT